MASGRQVVGEKNRSTAVVPIRIAAEHTEEPEDPRLSDVDEWGRSERTRALARAIYEPVYSKWFRTEWEGLEKIPTEGGALLVANHAGAIPSDAPVIMHGIEKELGRPVYGLADYFFRTMPVVGTLWARAGGVSARPANAYRLLKEQRQLALVFPEGTKGTSKSFTDRYQLRRFGRGGFVEIAMRAGVPVIPIAVVGCRRGDAGRAAPADPGPRPRAPLLPHHRQRARPRARSASSRRSPPSSSCACSTPCTSTSRRTRTGIRRAGSWRSPSASAHCCRSPCTTCCATGAASGSAEAPVSRRVLVTGADTFWGGRMVQALETDPGMDVILGMGAGTRRCPSSGPSSCGPTRPTPS